MPDELFELAVRALARKERSRAELIDWLAAKGADADEAEDVVMRLEAEGMIDDERFARRYAEDKRELAGWGSERIAESLRGRGISAEQIEAAIGASWAADDLERAVGLLEQRVTAVETDAERGRALGYLARRGYSSEIAHEAVRTYERRAREAASR